jgi:hypothetical protein
MDHPTVDESFDRLHRAGWSIGDAGTATRWIVTASNELVGRRRRAGQPLAEGVRGQ